MFGGQLVQATLQIGLLPLQGVEGRLEGTRVQRNTSHGSTYKVRQARAYGLVALLYAVLPQELLEDREEFLEVCHVVCGVLEVFLLERTIPLELAVLGYLDAQLTP